VYVFVTHPIFSDQAPTLLQSSPVKKVFVTDSVFIPEEKQFEKLEVLSLAGMIAKEIADK
jgi:ribose-phosphate pyrophosphokinase